MRKHEGTPSRRDKHVTLAAISPPGVARGRFVGGQQSGLAGCKPPPLFTRGASSCSSQGRRPGEPRGASPRPSAPTYLPQQPGSKDCSDGGSPPSYVAQRGQNQYIPGSGARFLQPVPEEPGRDDVSLASSPIQVSVSGPSGPTFSRTGEAAGRRKPSHRLGAVSSVGGQGSDSRLSAGSPPQHGGCSYHALSFSAHQPFRQVLSRQPTQGDIVAHSAENTLGVSQGQVACRKHRPPQPRWRIFRSV